MGADGSSSGLSKVPYGDSHYSVDVSGNTKLVKGRDGVKEGRKAPVESMIGNRVYAYANKKDILKEINVMGQDGLFQKQIGGGHKHFLTKEELKKYEKRQRKIAQNNPKRGKIGKSKKSEVEQNAHVHSTINHKNQSARYKLSTKERRILYESASLARRNGVKIWKK